MLTSTLSGEALLAPKTIATSALDPQEVDNTLVIQGAFGLSGVYPLDQTGYTVEGRAERHCDMYFVRIAASEATREKNPVVTEKTTYTLRFRGETYENEAMCTACLNRNCPANRNPAAAEGGWNAGVLVLPLE